MEPHADNLLALSGAVLDSLGEGVYVCDLDRRIVYWSKSAERITGWTAAEVVGRRCSDNVLCHVDKDGHHLCGEEFCPLHRAMVTGTASNVPLIIFAKTKDGRRMPTQAFVAPIRDADGAIVGGVERFRDATAALADLECAQRIQALSMEHNLPEDPRIRFTTFYAPRDVVGGDFFAIRRLDADRYGFLLADVMGHGVSAALHTMYLSTSWDRHHALLVQPASFARTVNNDLARIVKDESFATGVCGVIDARHRRLRAVSAGGPSGMAIRSGGRFEPLDTTGLPLGMMEDADYEESETRFEENESLLLYTDGAVDVQNARREPLGVEGLAAILEGMGYPTATLQMDAIEEQLLRYSNDIRLPDDVTFIEAQFLKGGGGGSAEYADSMKQGGRPAHERSIFS